MRTYCTDYMIEVVIQNKEKNLKEYFFLSIVSLSHKKTFFESALTFIQALTTL